MENGARFVDVELAAGSAAVFPMGAIHFEMNPSCEPAMFVAAFDGEDPGVGQVAQRCKYISFHSHGITNSYELFQTSVFPLTLLAQLSTASVSRRSSDSSP